MKIAFLNSPLLERGCVVEAEDCCWGKGKRILPSMVLSCAVEARAVGQEALYFDPSIPGEVLAIRDWGPDVIVYGLAWQYHKEVHQAMTSLFSQCRHVVLAVPPGYAEEYDKLLPRPAAVIRSEPETAMRALPRSVDDRLGWCRLRDRNYKVRVGRLNKLAPIDYNLVKSSYWSHYIAAVYQVTRGCPYRCLFCVWGGSTVTDHSFKMRPAALVAENLRQLRRISKEHLGKPIPLYLLAAQLTTSLKWIREFSDLMADDPYYFQSNVNLGEVTEENVRLLKRAGMASTSAGLEATSDTMLRAIGKPYTLDRAIDSILILQQNFRRLRLHVRTGFGETGENVLEALDGLRRMKERGVLNPHIDMAPLVHYKGTAIREKAHYPLEQLEGYDVESLVMADQPLDAWGKYADQLRSYGWLTRWGLTK